MKTILRACHLALLVLVLSACGGGGGSSTPPTSAGGTPTPVTPVANGSSDLLTHLSACPSTIAINDKVACMVGIYEGQAPSTGQACTFKYDANGLATYRIGTQSVQADLSLYSATVFEKKAASNTAGFAISWSLGIASGNEIQVSYLSAQEPASANGLLIKPGDTSLPACLVQSPPTALATGSGDTANLTGRSWQRPQLLNGNTGALGSLSDQPAFDAGLADDGRAVVAFRQADASGRMAVQVVTGQPGATGSSPSWSAPQVLDANAPLLTGAYRPRIAVSATGHAVVAWLSERPCEADAYEIPPTGKTCRYLYASRRLATEEAWEEARRVRASPPFRSQDHVVRINARGDIVIAFPSFYIPFTGSSPSNTSMLAIRHVADASYQAARLNGFWTNPVDATPFAERILSRLDDQGNLFLAGQSGGPFNLAQLRTTTRAAPNLVLSDVTAFSGVTAFDLRTSGNGFAAFTWREGTGSKQHPTRLTVYSPDTQAWLAPSDITAYTLWGDTTLVGTDTPDGEFLLYSGCKLTTWRAGTWGSTQSLPSYCGLDQAGGTYAFNQKGDYIGLNWAGQAGQWGHYSHSQGKLLKGAPGSAPGNSGDFVLGTASSAFDPATTQLLLAANGTALAVTSNAFTTLPSPGTPAGVPGSASIKLWAVYLK